MTKRCVVCGEEAHSYGLCLRHARAWFNSRLNLDKWCIRQVRANERRRYRELLRAADYCANKEHPEDTCPGMSNLRDAVRNAKARRSR